MSHHYKKNLNQILQRPDKNPHLPINTSFQVLRPALGQTTCYHDMQFSPQNMGKHKEQKGQKGQEGQEGQKGQKEGNVDVYHLISQMQKQIQSLQEKVKQLQKNQKERKDAPPMEKQKWIKDYVAESIRVATSDQSQRVEEIRLAFHHIIQARQSIMEKELQAVKAELTSLFKSELGGKAQQGEKERVSFENLMHGARLSGKFEEQKENEICYEDRKGQSLSIADKFEFPTRKYPYLNSIFKSGKPKVETQSDFTMKYLIDGQNSLMDGDYNYITDEQGNRITLAEGQISKLRESSIVKYVQNVQNVSNVQNGQPIHG